MEFRKALFDRSSFDDALTAHLRDHRIVYISAHAGWGKTVAVSQWVCGRESARMISARTLPKGACLPKGMAALAIDDLQELSDGELRQYLLPLLAEMPAKRCLLIGRAELPSALRPLALAGQLAVLDQTALCLSRDTIDTYLAETGLPYSVETSDFLARESKGYPVAVDCLAERIRSGMPCTEQTVQMAAQDVFDYFEQVVFLNLSREAQQFLLDIAQFSEFSLQMAAEVSGRKDLAPMLNEMMRRGKCMAQTAADRYAIPYFFHRFLVARQMKSCTDEAIGALWRRAGAYYETCDDIPKALHCYRQINDWNKLVELLIRHTRRPPYTTYHFELKDHYLALPPALIAQSPELMSSISMICSMNMRVQESEYWYGRLESFCHARSRNDPERKTAVERLAFLRIALPHRGTRSIAQTILDGIKLLQNDSQYVHYISPTSGIPSLMHGAKDFCNWSKRDESLYRLMKKPLESFLGKAGIGVADAGLAESKLERCTLQTMTAVMAYAASAMNQTEQAGLADVYFAAVASMARLSLMQGDPASAHRHLDCVENKVRQTGNSRLLHNVQAFRTRIFLLEGKTAKVSQWVREAAPDELGEFQLLNRYQYMVKVRCYILKGENREAIALLLRMLPYFAMYEHHYSLMEARILLAAAQYRMEQEDWKTPLELALSQAENYGFIRLFAEEGAALAPLLADMQCETQSKFRQALKREVVRYARLYPDYLKPPNLPEQPLTQAEKQVLRLLVQGMKNAQIAQALHIAVRTVKFHTGNIFAKLGVKSRAEAIVRSRKLFE